VAGSGDLVRSAMASRRGRSDGKLYARARPEKVKITEKYSVIQEISKSPTRRLGPGGGRIDIAVPYDGGQYFTHQAADDVKWGLVGRQAGGRGTAVIGHLRLVDHAKTDLRRVIGQMRQYHNVGVVPLEVPVAVDPTALASWPLTARLISSTTTMSRTGLRSSRSSSSPTFVIPTP